MILFYLVLQKVLELFNTQTCIVYDSSHRISIDGICSGYRNNSFAIGHRDMFALPCDPEAGFLKCFTAR
jgi:hypothetical protein